MPSLSYKKCCEILGIPEGLTAKEIRTAYRKKALTTHPDKAPSDDLRKSYEDKFKKVNEAFETLNDNDFKKFGYQEIPAEDESDDRVGNYDFFIKQLDGSIDGDRPEQQIMLERIKSKLNQINLRFDIQVHYEFKILSERMMMYLNALNNSYLPGETEAERNFNTAIVEICNNATLLCEKAMTAIQNRQSSAISHAQSLVLELTEVSVGAGKAICGLRSTDDKNPEINKLKQDLYVSGIEAASTLLQAYSSGFSKQVSKMHIDRDGYSFVSKNENEDFRRSKFEIVDLGKIMENFRKNNMRDLKININNLRWDTTYWKKFKIAASKLIAAIADIVIPERNKTIFDELTKKGTFVGLTRKLGKSMDDEAHKKKDHKK